ncbi:MAG: MarR family transcriptional regulator [bacterium]
MQSGSAAETVLPPSDTAPSSPSASPPPSARIAAELGRLVHSVSRFRASVAGATGGDSDWLLNLVLTVVVRGGPARVSTLAEAMQTDQSTASRQVAALVSQGLVERQPDPQDGRACLVVATPAGLEHYQAHVARRDQTYAEMLSRWSEEDQERFADLFARFVDDFDDHRAIFLAELSQRASSAGREDTS